MEAEQLLKDLISIAQFNDIPAPLQNTAVGRLLAYHNLGHAFQHHDRPELLIVTCMDYRVALRTPEGFAFVIRVAGARLRQRDFGVSFAIGVGGVSSIAVIGHTDCGMVNVASREEQFVRGLTERAGWEPEAAHSHFEAAAPVHEIGSETESAVSGARRLREAYKKIVTVPLVHRLEDKLLYLPKDWR